MVTTNERHGFPAISTTNMFLKKAWRRRGRNILVGSAGIFLLGVIVFLLDFREHRDRQFVFHITGMDDLHYSPSAGLIGVYYLFTIAVTCAGLCYARAAIFRDPNLNLSKYSDFLLRIFAEQQEGRRSFRILGSVCIFLVSVVYVVATVLPQFAETPWTFSNARSALVANLIILGIAIFLLFFLSRLFRALLNFATRCFLPSPDAVLKNDDRPPILYLRSFQTDAEKDQNNSVFDRLSGLSREARMVFALNGAGPVFTVGQPGELLPRLGACRLSLTDNCWQPVVQELMEKCGTVLLYMGTTSGILWETKEAVRLVDPEKLILFIGNPRKGRAEEHEKRYHQFCTLVEGIFPHPLPIDSHASRFVYFDKEWSPRLFEGYRRASQYGFHDALAEDIHDLLRAIGILPDRKRLNLLNRTLRFSIAIYILVIAIFAWRTANVYQQYVEDRKLDLHGAAATGNVESISTELNRGAPIEGIIEGLTPLQVAAWEGQLDAVELLHEKGARIDGELTGVTALALAATEGHREVVARLIGFGADVNEYSEGDTPLHQAAFNGHIEVMGLLLDAGANINALNDYGFPPLMDALHGGEDAIRFLVSRGGDIFFTKDGMSLLHIVNGEFAPVVKVLSELGFDLEVLSADGQTPLEASIIMRDLDMARAIVEAGGEVNLTRRYGMVVPSLAWLPLTQRPMNMISEMTHAAFRETLAADEKDLELFKLLVQSGADIETLARANIQEMLKDLEDLDLPASVGSEQVATVMELQAAGVEEFTLSLQTKMVQRSEFAPDISKSALQILMGEGASLDGLPGETQTPLGLAATKGMEDMVAFLLEHGADPNATNAHGLAPLHYSVMNQDFLCGRLLVAAGADPYVSTTDMDPPAFLAVSLESEEILRFLKLLGADVAHGAAEGGMSLLHGAAILGATRIAGVLLDEGAEVDAQTVAGETALLAAIRHGNLECVRLLIERGANLEIAEPSSGETALHAAILSRSVAFINLLLAAGANAEQTDRHGKTARDYAIEIDCNECIQALKDFAL